MRRYFITGTDTGVGKTWVTCSLARLAVSRGQRVFAFKPIETGCSERDGRLVGEDQELLCDAAGGWQEGELRGVYRFRLPAAPHVAAAAEGSRVEDAPLAAAVSRGTKGADLVLIEGAGGWRVPIREDLDMGGYAKQLGAPVILVGRAGLGTINHCLLTAEAILRDGLELAAVVLSVRPDDDRAFAGSNASEISRCLGRSVLLSSDPGALTLL